VKENLKMANIAKPDANGNNVEFDNAYWAHQSPAVQKLRTMDITGWAGMYFVTQAAAALSDQGLAIDVPIMVWRWDPFKIMSDRIAYGYTWVPAAKMPAPVVAPGVTQPGTTAYDPSSVPAGAIKVSLDFDDYPPYAGV